MPYRLKEMKESFKNIIFKKNVFVPSGRGFTKYDTAAAEIKMGSDIGLDELADEGFVRKEGNSWQAHMWVMSAEEMEQVRRGSRNNDEMRDKIREKAQQLLSEKLGREIRVERVTEMGPGRDRNGIERSVFAVVFSDKVGGIDMSQASLDMQIKRDGAGVPLPINQQNLDNIRIDGLVPVILNIQPATDAPLFAGAGMSTP